MLIRSNYYFLLKDGFSLDELKNLEVHEFEYYVRQHIEEIKEENERRKKSFQK